MPVPSLDSHVCMYFPACKVVACMVTKDDVNAVHIYAPNTLCIELFVFQVELKALAIENVEQSHKCDQTEMAAGLYPPSLKFRITYEYERNYTHRRRAHMVSLTGCDKESEVTFGIDILEQPATESGPGMCRSVGFSFCYIL